MPVTVILIPAKRRRAIDKPWPHLMTDIGRCSIGVKMSAGVVKFSFYFVPRIANTQTRARVGADRRVVSNHRAVSFGFKPLVGSGIFSETGMPEAFPPPITARVIASTTRIILIGLAQGKLTAHIQAIQPKILKLPGPMESYQRHRQRRSQRSKLCFRIDHIFYICKSINCSPNTANIIGCGSGR